MADPAPTRFWNVPNTLTMSRLVFACVVIVLLSNEYYIAALLSFGLASLTDALDGYFARLLNQASVLGRQLDPLIDKVIISGVYIYLIEMPGKKTGVQPWMVTVIVVRELLIQGLRSHLEGQGEPFGAKMAGKLKMLFQCLSISAILLGLSPALHLAPAWFYLRDALTWIAVGLTIYSGLGYVVMALPKLRGE